MRTIVVLVTAGCLGMGLIGSRSVAEDRSPLPPAQMETRFRAEVRPFLETYCFGCHGKDKPKGELDLSAFATAQSVAKDLPDWERVLQQLKATSMPPAKANPKPAPEARDRVIAWVESLRNVEAARNAGDPGRVLARRLSNAEYDNTI